MCQIEAHEYHHGKELDCAAVVSRSLEYHVYDSMFWVVSTPILRENTLGVVRDVSPLFLFHQPHERTYGSTTA
ncbi:hypothetical protein TNCV_4362821 [Trichonephila clavipes]|nr:hypothetical protein TNCV_4362821 [Trichonephila clavipes]